MAEEKGYKRVMPHHPEAERSVIGAMLLDRSSPEKLFTIETWGFILMPCRS